MHNSGERNVRKTQSKNWEEGKGKNGRATTHRREGENGNIGRANTAGKGRRVTLGGQTQQGRGDR